MLQVVVLLVQFKNVAGILGYLLFILFFVLVYCLQKIQQRDFLHWFGFCSQFFLEAVLGLLQGATRNSRRVFFQVIVYHFVITRRRNVLES
jgi:hypothetical protein